MRDVTLAWNVERIKNQTRAQKKMPSLASLLRELDRSMGAEPHRQSVGQMKTMLHLLSAKYGIPLRKATKH